MYRHETTYVSHTHKKHLKIIYYYLMDHSKQFISCPDMFRIGINHKSYVRDKIIFYSGMYVYNLHITVYLSTTIGDKHILY